MKKILGLFAATFLASCISFGGSSGPTQLAHGATLGMWTSRPTDNVRACVRQVLNETPSQYRYEVTANDKTKTDMVTTISGFTNGHTDPVQERIAQLCLSGG